MRIALRAGAASKVPGLACLSFACGSADALSFLKFGDVFTSAMTGNTALLAIATGRGHLLAASHSLAALLGFTIGVIVAAALRDLQEAAKSQRQELQRLLVVEIVCLAGCAALWTGRGGSLDGSVLYIVILLSAAGMGIQGVAARMVESTGINTIVFTSVLISILTSLTAAFAGRFNPFAALTGIRAYLSSFAAYIAGGLVAALFVEKGSDLVVWIPVIAVVFALGFWSILFDAAR